ncbi:MAG: ABC transporter substrate-binding protein [Lachnospiraceae bacterium]
MNIKKILCLTLVTLLLTSLVSGCGNKEHTKKSASQGRATATDCSWSDVEKAGVLKIGLCPEYPPFESVTDDGSIEGFDPSLAAAIGKELGVTVEFVNTPWEGLIAGLGNGDFDLVMSAMSPDEATSATDAVSLSDPYYELKDIIVVGKDNTDITKKEDLTGKNIGYQTGSAAEQVIDGLTKQNITIGVKSPYNRNADAFADLANGRIDAIVVSYPYAVTMAKENDTFKVINDTLQSCNLVAVMGKDAKELTLKYNNALKTIKENQLYTEIESQWLSIE